MPPGHRALVGAAPFWRRDIHGKDIVEQAVDVGHKVIRLLHSALLPGHKGASLEVHGLDLAQCQLVCKGSPAVAHADNGVVDGQVLWLRLVHPLLQVHNGLPNSTSQTARLQRKQPSGTANRIIC